ncbi:MAG: hypothetical protein U9Q30_00840 [Campylobacterota bacterium]|nr:hypothetical protein [Campylobacterota bacterium]
MNFYIKSRGSAHHQDYMWYKINQDYTLIDFDIEKELEDIESKLDKYSKYNYSNENILVIRFANDINYLLIDNIKSNRKDAYDRVIKNTILIQFTTDLIDRDFIYGFISYASSLSNIKKTLNNMIENTDCNKSFSLNKKIFNQFINSIELTSEEPRPINYFKHIHNKIYDYIIAQYHLG